jgi:hypothetical protein
VSLLPCLLVSPRRWVTGWRDGPASKGARRILTPRPPLNEERNGGKLIVDVLTVRLEPWQTGFAVRRDWSIDGTHEFVGFSATAADAGWFAVADRAYWRRSPMRPVHSVVETSLRDFKLHATRRACRAPDCPVAPPVITGMAIVDGVR